jgi:hypothetical protein
LEPRAALARRARARAAAVLPVRVDVVAAVAGIVALMRLTSASWPIQKSDFLFTWTPRNADNGKATALV